MRIPNVEFLLAELREARAMSYGLRDLTKIVYSTLLSHLGNRYPPLISNAVRSVRCRAAGAVISLEFRQNPADLRVIHEVFGAHIYWAPYEVLGDVRTIVDLGAHIGCATLYFGALFPSAKIVAVEPVPANYELLRRNCRGNGKAPLLINKCIGADGGNTTLYLDPSCYQYGVDTRRSNGARSPSLELETTTMDSLLDQVGPEDIDLLKVDIEGAELDLFARSASWINRVRLIVIEIHPSLVDYQTVIHSVTKNGFRFYPAGVFSPECDVFARKDVALRISKMTTGQEVREHRGQSG